MTPDLNGIAGSNIQLPMYEAAQIDDKAIWQKLRREVKALSLDLWGTILDDEHAPAATMRHSERRQLGYDFSPEQMRAAYRHVWKYFDDLWQKQIAFGAAAGLYEMLRYLNADMPLGQFQRVQRFFEEVHDDPPPIDGAIEAVQALAKKYPLALISDTAWTPGRVLRLVFANHNILTCFRTLVFSGEVGVTKPHPKIFQLALAGLGVQPQECLHIGDLQRTDIAGAKAAGMRTAWIRAGEGQPNHGPLIVMKSVMEAAEKLLHL
jgi:putative hydrolase of the HAD superfamily